MASALQTPLDTVRKIVVAVIGGTVVLFGVALLVLPGPAFVVIPVGLAILATEFVWARRWLKRVRDAARSVAQNPAQGSRREQSSLVRWVRRLRRHRQFITIGRG